MVMIGDRIVGKKALQIPNVAILVGDIRAILFYLVLQHLPVASLFLQSLITRRPHLHHHGYTVYMEEVTSAFFTNNLDGRN